MTPKYILWTILISLYVTLWEIPLIHKGLDLAPLDNYACKLKEQLQGWIQERGFIYIIKVLGFALLILFHFS